MVNRRFNHETFSRNKHTGIDMRGIVRQQNLRDRYIDKEMSLIESSGSPYLWFRRLSQYECHCRDTVNLTAHENCPTCHGSGYLRSWEKNGYQTYTFSKTWPDVDFSGAKFLKGWGYNEVASGEFLTPFIDISAAKGISLIKADHYSPTQPEPIIEWSYDDQAFFPLSEPIDFSSPQIKFKVRTFGSRFLRVRVRTSMYSATTIDIPSDVYSMISVTDKRKRAMVVDDQKLEIDSDDSEAWTLEQIESGDFLVDIVGSIGSDNQPGIYLIDGVRVGQHQPGQLEHRRDFTMNYIMQNSWQRTLYNIEI